MEPDKFRSGISEPIEWVLHTEVPDYQTTSSGCPMCYSDLHYSSGWDRRMCDMCGYVEGMTGTRCYPVPLSMSEWHALYAHFYRSWCQRLISRQELDDLIWAFTPYGSFYRPYNESDI